MMYSLDKFGDVMAALFARIDMLETNLLKLSDADRLLTGKEIDALYGITKPTRIAWQKKGLLTPIRKGKRNYFKSNELLPKKQSIPKS